MISLLSQSCCWVHLGNFSFYLYFLTLKSPLVNFYSFPFSIEVPYSLTHYFLLIFKHSFYSLFVFMTDTLKSFWLNPTWRLIQRVYIDFSSVQFSPSVASNSLWPHGLQRVRPHCPSPTPGVYSNSCPLSRWWHATISFSVTHFSRLQSLPASGSFPTSQFFASGGQTIGVSASASVLPMNIQDWFSSGFDGFDLLAVQGTLRSLLQHHSSKASILQHSAFLMVQLSCPYMTTGKTIALTRWNFVGK